MIYFDNNKKAYGYKIQRPTCSIEARIWADYAGTDKWDIVNGIFTDISDTPEYLAKKQVKQNAELKIQLQKQIDDIDIKRIRAMAEPSLKDSETTWLDYYTEQIQIIRDQIQAL